MAVWSPDGPEGFEDNVSVGEDIWLRSLEVDLMKIQDNCKDLESKLGLLKFWNMILTIFLTISILFSFIAMFFIYINK
ncbi:unnamed protein product [Trifolium pratense]|uniref:Uncharacterized protein n=1 Tax=Trifolium pratense TaxID=57577 RepID=A0ACB0IZI6_TRIPR|nr:unnamed protein product [Trifolium pratense]